jgi:hypothetical protein
MGQQRTSAAGGALGAGCQHHWVIETPNGATSGGHCKRCGATREFRNSSEDLLWDNDSFSLNGTRYRGRRASGERLAESA